MTERVQCPHCERTFADDNARWQHVKAVHGRSLARKLPRPEREESMGDLAARAHWDDDPELDWVREVFDIERSHP